MLRAGGQCVHLLLYIDRDEIEIYIAHRDLSVDLMAGKQKGSMEAAAGDVIMQCPSTKRNAVAESSHQEEPTSLDAAAIEKLLQAAILVKQAQGGAGPKLTRRLTKGEIRSIIAFKPEPFPSADYLDELAEFDPPESIAERKRQHAEDVARFGEFDEKYEAFRQEVMRGINKDGYYEVDVEYVARREKANIYAKQHVRQPFGFLTPEERRRHGATPEQDRRWRLEGCYGKYLPDKEEELLIDCGEEDDSDAE